MKRLMLVALLGTLSLAAPAQTTQDNAVTIRGYQIELPAVPHRMSSGDLDTYKGSYELANGGILSMRKIGRHMYAELGDGQRRELVAAGPNVFVALDRQVKVTINRDDSGDASGELLMVSPATSVAQAPQVRHMRLASLR